MKTFNAFWYLILLSFLTSPSLFAQREADKWIMGIWASLNFSNGNPIAWFPDFIVGSEFEDGAIMSDTSGKLLFYSNGVKVWNRNWEIMDNGQTILPGGNARTQSCVAFPKPGSAHLYYLFCVSSSNSPEGLYYSIIDMELDGGLGDVTSEKNIELETAKFACEKLFVVKKIKVMVIGL